MPLIICPDCSKEISDTAYNCPNCGRPMRHSRESILLEIQIASDRRQWIFDFNDNYYAIEEPRAAQTEFFNDLNNESSELYNKIKKLREMLD